MTKGKKSVSIGLGLVVIGGAILLGTRAKAAPQNQCPVCEQFFPTYEELYNHFITAHPAIPIDITWE